MRKRLIVVTAVALVFGASPASAALHSLTTSLNVAIGTLPAAGFSGAAAAASSAGAGGAATLPSGSISGVFQNTISPPLLTLIDGVGLAAPGLGSSLVDFASNALPATNNPLSFDGVTGTMSLNASAYLLMAGDTILEIPLGVVGVGGTAMFHVLSLVAGVINANPYQLGMLTLMGALNTAPHTLTATGVDNRTAGGEGTLVLVSPTNVSLGVLGNLASISTLVLDIGPAIPEPGTVLLVGAGVVALAIGRRRIA
jgi:hypothetical protein